MADNKSRMERHIDQFLALKSPGSHSAYTYALKLWASFIGSRYAIATVGDAVAFYGLLRKRAGTQGASADATVRKYWAAISSFYKFLVAIGVAYVNPLARATPLISNRQRTQIRPTPLVPFELVSKFLQAPDPATKIGVRDRAILAILFGGGLRRSEVVPLELQDIGVTPDGALFAVLKQTKAGKRQSRRLAPWVWESVNDLTIQRRKDGAKDNSPLFTAYNKAGASGKTPLISGRIYKIFRRYADEVGFSCGPHAARATAASMLASMGYRDRDIAEMLGHSTTDMVRIYDKRSRSIDNNVVGSLKYPRVA